MAKIAASLKAGDRLPPRTVRTITVQKAYEVKRYSKDGGEWIKVTTEDGFEDHFPLTAPVVYPRRDFGTNMSFLDEDTVLPIEEVAIGDIIRPIGVEGPVALKDAWVVRHIVTMRRGGTDEPAAAWAFAAASVSTGESFRFHVPGSRYHGDLYGEGTRVPYEIAEETAKKAADKHVNASGWYVNQLTGEKVRFRLGKLKGRPPVGSEEAPHELGSRKWTIYDLVDGETPHPSDPRYSK